jgi:hypothetical protein
MKKKYIIYKMSIQQAKKLAEQIRNTEDSKGFIYNSCLSRLKNEFPDACGKDSTIKQCNTAVLSIRGDMKNIISGYSLFGEDNSVSRLPQLCLIIFIIILFYFIFQRKSLKKIFKNK